jgi:hypothetical protein
MRGTRRRFAELERQVADPSASHAAGRGSAPDTERAATRPPT